MKLATTTARAFVALALCVLSFSVAAQSAPPLTTGNGLLSLAEAYERAVQGRGSGNDGLFGGQFQGFVAGVAWTLDDLDSLACVPDTATVGQIGAVVLQYLRQNPAQLHRASWVLAREALQKAFPCRR